jgi:hypothetical protein
VIRLAAIAACAISMVTAQPAPPAIAQNGVVNSASRIPSTLPGGAITSGGRFTIFGVHFGLREHTTVTIQYPEGAMNAIILSESAGQIDARIPESVKVGTASLIVTVDGRSSVPFPITIASSNPGIFSINGQGWGRARGLKGVFKPGDRVKLIATGLGANRHPKLVLGSGLVLARRVAETNGEETLEFTIPADAPLGCDVPVALVAGPARLGNTVSLAISKSGSCDPGPVPKLDRETIGVVVMSRTATKQRDGDFVSDEAAAVFASTKGGADVSPLLMLPPTGTCTAYTTSLQSDAPLPNSISSALVSLLGDRGLDAGSQFVLRRSVDSREIVRVRGVSGYYRGGLGEAGPVANRHAPASFLDPGEFTLSSGGGKQIGAFDIPVLVNDSFEWTNRNELDRIDRVRGVTIRWRRAGKQGVGGKPDEGRGHLIAMLATNLDQITTAAGSALCVADAAANQFTIPARMLGNIPASRDLPGAHYDQLFVTSLPARPSAELRAQGLAGGAVVTLYTIGRFVKYR